LQEVGLRMKDPCLARPNSVSSMREMRIGRPPAVRGWSAKVVSSA
jgi:hypothetical protein